MTAWADTNRLSCLYLMALEARRRVSGEEHPLTSRTRFLLASLSKEQHHYREAESAAPAAYQGYFGAFGSDHENTQGVIQLLIEMYTVAGQPTQAAEWRGSERYSALALKRAKNECCYQQASPPFLLGRFTACSGTASHGLLVGAEGTQVGHRAPASTTCCRSTRRPERSAFLSVFGVPRI